MKYLLMLLLIFTTAVCYADEALFIPSDNASAKILASLEKQVKGVLQDCGYESGSFYLSGNINIGKPVPLKKSAEGVSQKYSCEICCDIQVKSNKSNAPLFEVNKSFNDIGRTLESARRYALGKVVRVLYEDIIEKKIVLPRIGTILQDLKKQESALSKHSEILARLVEEIVRGSFEKISSPPAVLKTPGSQRKEGD